MFRKSIKWTFFWLNDFLRINKSFFLTESVQYPVVNFIFYQQLLKQFFVFLSFEVKQILHLINLIKWRSNWVLIIHERIIFLGKIIRVWACLQRFQSSLGFVIDSILTNFLYFIIFIMMKCSYALLMSFLFFLWNVIKRDGWVFVWCFNVESKKTDLLFIFKGFYLPK